MPCATLWFYLCDCGEDMRKWYGAPTLVLEVCVHELWEKAVVKNGPSRKITAPVGVEQFPRCSQRAEDSSPLSDTDPMDLCLCGFEPHNFYHGKTMLVCSRITPVNSPCSVAWARERDMDCFHGVKTYDLQLQESDNECSDWE